MQEPRGRNPGDFGRRIRQWRDRQGLTLAQLADKSGLSIGYLSLLERGQKIPSPEAAASLAQALGDDEDLYRSWAAAMRAGVRTSDVRAIRFEASPAEPFRWSASAMISERTLPSPAQEPDVVAVRVLPPDADPIDPTASHDDPPLYLDRRFIGAERGDRLFAYEMTSDAAAQLDDVARPGDHIVFSSRVTRITPSRVYAVRTSGRVVAARLALVGESVVVVPSGGERDVEVIKGEWRDVVRGVAVVVIRRLLPRRSPSEQRPRFAAPETRDGDLIARLVHGGSDAVMEMRRRYEPLIEHAIRQSALPADEQRALLNDIWHRLTGYDREAVRRWKSEGGSFVPYLARLVRWAFNDHARRKQGLDPGPLDLATEDALDALPPGALGPLDILRERERMKAIESAITNLNARDQELIYRRYVFQQPNSEIAEALVMSGSSVHVALHRARMRFELMAKQPGHELLGPVVERMRT